MFLSNSCIEFIYTVNEWVTNSRVWTNERKKFSLFLSHVSSSWSWFCKNITQSKEKRREEKRREKKRREEKADSLRSFVNETHKIPMYLSARILLWFQTDVILRLLLFPLLNSWLFPCWMLLTLKMKVCFRIFAKRNDTAGLLALCWHFSCFPIHADQWGVIVVEVVWLTEVYQRRRVVRNEEQKTGCKTWSKGWCTRWCSW